MPAALRVSESSAFYLYLATAHGRFDRVMASAPLREPRIKNFDKAIQLLDRLIETTLGLAVGRMIGAVVHGMRASFDRSIAKEVEQVLAAAVIESPKNATLDLAPQSFSDAFRSDVRRRLLLAPRTVQPVLEAIVQVANEHDVTERMLELLADDPLPADRFAKDITEGWRVFSVLTANQRVSAAASPWDAWVQRIEGGKPVVTETQIDLAAAGYINRI
jgi:hypothetical protein